MARTHARVTAALAAAVSRLVADVDGLCREMEAASRRDLEEQRAEPHSSMPRMYAIAQRDWRSTSVPVLGLGFIGADAPTRDGRYFWWYTPHDGHPTRQLVASSLPNTLTYYDPAHSDWWQGALRTDDGTYATGPYVDIAGTNAYVVTFARAVRVGDDIAGVVTADVFVGDLQDLWRSELLGAKQEVCVVDGEGSVIATNSGRLLGGNFDPHGASKAAGTGVDGTSWYVFAVEG